MVYISFFDTKSLKFGVQLTVIAYPIQTPNFHRTYCICISVKKQINVYKLFETYIKYFKWLNKI